jgi:hypothetical protein
MELGLSLLKKNSKRRIRLRRALNRWKNLGKSKRGSKMKI